MLEVKAYQNSKDGPVHVHIRRRTFPTSQSSWVLSLEEACELRRKLNAALDAILEPPPEET